jgi:hypothetical protein
VEHGTRLCQCRRGSPAEPFQVTQTVDGGTATSVQGNVRELHPPLDLSELSSGTAPALPGCPFSTGRPEALFAGATADECYNRRMRG